MLIFERSQSGRCATAQIPFNERTNIDDLPEDVLRKTEPLLPAVSELEVVRHYTNLSEQNFSIDTHFYPLGSCTMKYNPHCSEQLASLENFLCQHPFSAEKDNQGFMQCLYELQEMLKQITGLNGVSLTPMAGAQGEFAGVAMIRAYHESKKDFGRTEIIVPDAAHGTNPASAIMCGYKVKEIPTDQEGDIIIEELKKAVGPQTAGIMLTNPSTLGVFERRIKEVADIVHQVGGLLYYDGANMNANLGRLRPSDMGFDVIHLNLHKTFATPHGGGGPGSGPVLANDKLKPFLPIPFVEKNKKGFYWTTKKEYPKTIGRLGAFMGNTGVNLKAYIYLRLVGQKGLREISDMATLNANYLMQKLKDAGFKMAFPNRRAVHEFVLTLEDQKQKYNIKALDYAKRLLDYGYHAPTIYFPLIIPECMLIEPTETESKQTLDEYVEIMKKIKHEAETDPEKLKQAPENMPLHRLDDVRAARELDLVYKVNSLL